MGGNREKYNILIVILKNKDENVHRYAVRGKKERYVDY